MKSKSLYIISLIFLISCVGGGPQNNNKKDLDVREERESGKDTDSKADKERKAKAEQQKKDKSEEEKIAKSEQERKTKSEEEKIAKSEQEKKAKSEVEKILKTQEEKKARKSFDEIVQLMKSDDNYIALFKFDWETFSGYVTAYQKFVADMKDPNSEIMEDWRYIEGMIKTYPNIKKPFVELFTSIGNGTLNANWVHDEKAISLAIATYEEDENYGELSLALNDRVGKIISNSGLKNFKDFVALRDNLVTALTDLVEDLKKKYDFDDKPFQDQIAKLRELKIGGKDKDERVTNLDNIILVQKQVEEFLKQFKK